MKDLLDRIWAACPDPLLLSTDECAKLAAYLKTYPIGTFGDAYRGLHGDLAERSKWNENRARRVAYRCTLEYNRERLAPTAPEDVSKESKPATMQAKPEAPAELPDLVTLGQAAALVNRQPSGLRHYRNRGMPRPFIKGTKGKPNEYLVSEMRPWLEKTFNRRIPDVEIKKFRGPVG